jgi:hypothetical protein
MLYFNPQALLNSASGNTKSICVASGGLLPVELESLMLIVDLRSQPIVNLKKLAQNPSIASYSQVVQLSFREKGQQFWSVIAEIYVFNRGEIYRENLMPYLTFNSEWRLAPNYEMAIGMIGTPLTGTDTIQVFGAAYQPDI